MTESNDIQNEKMIAIAMNAAGISDAFARARTGDHDGSDRYVDLANHFSGWIGIAQVLAEAAIEMEVVRVRVGEGADWGDGLPFWYDAWEAVGRALWDELPTRSAAVITRDCLRRLIFESDSQDEE